MYIDDLKVEDIEDFLFYLKEEKSLASASRSRHQYTLRAFWKYACNKDLCKQNIANLIEPIKIKKQERTFLTTEEAHELIEAIDHPLTQLICKTLFYTGMRIGECLNLRLKDVDFEKNMIYIINGKGKKDRNIPLNKNLIPPLKDYLSNWRPDVDTDYLFATSKTGKISSVYVNRIIKDTVERLGWEKKVTAHILRHSFASNLIKKGVNIVHVQKLLGHSNLKVTSIYTHTEMDDLNESVNLL
ncbi:tyrosine-type recombinase/integrase [Anaerosalibacter sp. Marseille-P3206]|uniref:tyrosine-type recombinase/integrase n=1 Tax=Anaerosalibacter sp. Marseille-P3206 TaxID=1871005 RepID=UPI00190EEDF1|nr:tyrosine-type recombinase/integrase [Anaerosalibacter sp. Marseille-P3206]